MDHFIENSKGPPYASSKTARVQQGYVIRLGPRPTTPLRFCFWKKILLSGYEHKSLHFNTRHLFLATLTCTVYGHYFNTCNACVGLSSIQTNSCSYLGWQSSCWCQGHAGLHWRHMNYNLSWLQLPLGVGSGDICSFTTRSTCLGSALLTIRIRSQLHLATIRGVDFGRQPGRAPPKFELHPCIYQFLPNFSTPKFWFSPPIFLTGLCQWPPLFVLRQLYTTDSQSDNDKAILILAMLHNRANTSCTLNW